MWWDIIKSDDLHKDFKLKKPWKARFIMWAGNKINQLLGGPPKQFLMLGGYQPKTGEADAYLDDIKEYRRRYGGTYPEILTEILTHEYVHKVLSEDPEINKLLEPYRKHRFDPMAVSAQEWAANQMATTNELKALENLLEHPVVPQSTKIKAQKKMDMIYDKMDIVEAEVVDFLEENPVEEQ
tara:strand:+ start:3230 stop:3775 length:546 start_codon:yes stop_codon:yes gene_type:complete